MTKKLADLLEDILKISFIILIFFWFTNKTKFFISIIIILVAIFIIILVIRSNKRKRFNEVYNWHQGRDLLKKLQAMHPNEFEDYIADIYSRLGYDTEQVGGSYDGGIDVIATKDGVKHYIQCKKFITQKVGVGAMRDFYGAMAGKLSNSKGIFITTNIFTTEAENFAEDKPIELIDGDNLLKLIKLAKKDKEMDKCPNCGGGLVERHGRYGKFYGCSNYPKCHFIKEINNKS